MLDDLDPTLYASTQFSPTFDATQDKFELIDETDKDFGFWMRTWEGQGTKGRSMHKSASLPVLTRPSKESSALGQPKTNVGTILPKVTASSSIQLSKKPPDKAKRSDKEAIVYSSAPIARPKYSIKKNLSRKDIFGM